MCHCITPQALLQGLVRRVEFDGYRPTAADLRALIGSGCGVEEVRALVRSFGGANAEALRSAFDAAFPLPTT